jgi:hypothetical protein
LWRGPSLIDRRPIVVIATLESDNTKTGDMIQTWILRADLSPVEAVASGRDASICGDCPLRGDRGVGRGCYVNVGQAPQSIWRAFRRRRYPRYSVAKHGPWFVGRSLRLGAYGDPTASPFEAWESVLNFAGRLRTGYTHQWRACDQRWRDVLMASVESMEDAEAAAAAGWRTFRVRRSDGLLMAGERVCPASDEGGKRKQCVDCYGCSGAEYGRGGYAIVGHGSAPRLHAIERIVA